MPRTKYIDWALSVRLLEAEMNDRVRDIEGTDLEGEDPLYFNKLLTLRDQAQRLRKRLEGMSEYVLNREPAIPPGYRLLQREPRIGEEVQPRWLEKTPSGEEPGLLALPQRVAGIYKDKVTTKVYTGPLHSSTPFVWNKDEQRFLLAGSKVDLLVRKSD